MRLVLFSHRFALKPACACATTPAILRALAVPRFRANSYLREFPGNEASGARSAALSVTDNAPGSPQTLPLSGAGTTAKLSPTSLNFGSVSVGTSSAAKTATLTNVGTTTLTITGIAITGTNAGDFSQTHTCGRSLAVGASCTISVTFKPTATGARSGTLAVSDNAAGSPQKVTLSGTGI